MINIDNFVDDLNYTNIIVHVDTSICLHEVKAQLEKDQLNHMSYWVNVLENRLFYIENCDLQTVNYVEMIDLIQQGYGVFNLKRTIAGKYFLETGHDGLVN